MNIVVSCPAVQLSHGTIEFTKQPINGTYPVNTILLFLCDYSYRIPSGYNSTTTCLVTGNWSNAIPYCQNSKNNT